MLILEKFKPETIKHLLMKVVMSGPLETIIFLHGSGPGVSAQSNWKEILPHFRGYSMSLHRIFSDSEIPIILRIPQKMGQNG